MDSKSLHEIRNQLHQIVGYAELLRINPHKYNEYSDLIERSSYMVDVLARETLNSNENLRSNDTQDHSTKITNNLFENINILIVDDFEFNRNILKDVFSKLKCTIECADSAKEALRLHDSFNPDIVFMDIVMPDMTGDEVTKLLKTAGSRAKFIAVSALNEYSKKNISIFDAWIEKPYTPDQILDITTSLFTNEIINTNNDEISIILDDLSKEEKGQILNAIDRGALSEIEFIIDNIADGKSKNWLKKQLSNISLQNIKNIILSA